MQKTLLINRNPWKTIEVLPHSMHNLCSRVCSFPISIPDYYIKKFSNTGDVVFDPWCGKGTVPFEALRNNRIGIGNDRSPEAFVFTHAKIRPISYPSFEKYIIRLKMEMTRSKPSYTLTELDKKALVFYSEKTFEQILRLQKILLKRNSKKAIFVKAIVLGLLHGNSVNSFSLRCSHSYSMSPNYVKNYAKTHHLRRPSKDIMQCILNKGRLLLSDELPTIQGLALRNDSTQINLESKSVDMILTSPPYFDIQTYAWANWLRLWFLGYDYRKIRKRLAESGSMAKYLDFMKNSLFELYRVLRPRGNCFIVVGDIRKNVKGTYQILNTAKLLSPLCIEAGFRVEKIVEDTIPSTRRVMTYIPATAGIKTERIIYLSK